MKDIAIILALIATCCSTSRKYETKTVAVQNYCVELCKWADKCGGFYPEACGDLCTAPDCETACAKEVCAATGTECEYDEAPKETDEEVDQCIAGVEASTNDCTGYRPNPPGCGFAGL